MSLTDAYLLGGFQVRNCPVDGHLVTRYSEIDICDSDCCYCNECNVDTRDNKGNQP